MKHSRAGAFVVGLTAGLAAWVFVGHVLGQVPGPGTRPDEKSPVFDVPGISGIEIDGDAGDWGERGFRVELMAAADGRTEPLEDFDPRFRLAWDERGLLVLFALRDDQAVEAANDDLWLGDSLEVFVAEHQGAARYYQALVAPGGSAEHAEPRQLLNPRSLAFEPDPPKLSIEVAAKTVAAGTRTVELLLPWSNLGLTPRSGDEIALQIFANDSDDRADDTAAKKFRAVWFPTEASDNDSRLMHRLRLAEKASGPVRLRAEASYEPTGQVRVDVTAGGALAGKTVELRDGTKRIASAALTPQADGAAAHFTVLPGGKGRPFRALKVAVERAAPQAVYAPREQLALNFLTETRVQPRLASSEGVFRGVSVDLVATVDGQVAKTGTCDLGETVELGTGPGFYRLEARVVDTFGRTLEAVALMMVGVGPEEAIAQVHKRLSDPVFEGYAGWIEYLSEKARQAADFETGRRATFDLLDWAQRIQANPRLLAGLRGQQEWAHLSKVDGTGQPFMIWIPEDYDPGRAHPLHLYLHGAGGVHAEWVPWLPQDVDPQAFYISALGRSTASWWSGLGEVDALEVLDYVKAHWHVDEDRVHLLGTSMGGGGTFKLAARHPDLFASASPMCGFGIDVPIENLLHVPFYALHSSDDWMVAVCLARMPARRLAELGGLAIVDETVGVGHEINLYRSGIERAMAWPRGLARAKGVREVRYTASDEAATGAYWARVVEWGKTAEPASIHARLGDDNSLHLNLANVTTARFDLAAAPVDRSASMMVVIDRQMVTTVAAPLPAALYVTADPRKGWIVCEHAPALAGAGKRLHFPGGQKALYHGEPLLIVWGTGGEEPMKKALYDIAQVSRVATGPYWPSDKVSFGHYRFRTLYGQLPGKPDVEVTDGDMARYNLLLLGAPQENSVVARLMPTLPVRIEEGQIVTDDGASWPFRDSAVGLLYYNPLAPQRMVYWIAADDPAVYRAGRGWIDHALYGDDQPDFAVLRKGAAQAVAARHFDSRWRWQEGYGRSPLVSDELCTWAGVWRMLAEVMRAASGADFAVLVKEADEPEMALTAGQTRVADVLAARWPAELVVAELTGKELVAAVQAMAGRSDPMIKEEATWTCWLAPTPRPEELDGQRTYRVVMMPGWVGEAYAIQTQTNPPSMRLIDADVRGAIERYLVRARAPEPVATTQPSAAPASD